MTINPINLSFRIACGALLSSGLVSAQADFAAKVLSNTPVGYWRLNDKAQTPAPDFAVNLGSLGAAANTFYLGNAAHPVPSLLAVSDNTAAGFDGADGTAVRGPAVAALSPTNAFTIEFWAQPNVTQLADNSVLTSPLASLYRNTTAPANNANGWIFYQGGTFWNFRAGSSSGYKLNISGTTAPEAGVTYYIVATFDGTTARLYVNGVEEVSGAASGPLEPNVSVPFGIGARGDNSFRFDGTVDEVAVYPAALPPSEVLAHYQNGKNASPAKPYKDLVLAQNPLGYWRLDEPAYTAPTTLPVAKNLGSAGTSGDGSYNPGVDTQAAGPRPTIFNGFEADNTAGGLNGNVGFVGTPTTLNDLAQFTIMGWIKRGALHSGRGGYFGQNDLLEFGDADSGANIEAYINAHSANIKFPYAFKDNEWGFYTIVGDGTQVIVYTNGLAAASSAKVVDSYGSSAYFFNIGGGGVFNATGDFFQGNIDEVALFDKALTAEQVQDLYFSANIAPTILTQPVAPDRVLFEGNTVTLSASATGTPTLLYQWRKAGVEITGKTSSDLVFSNIKVADAGAYDLVVHNTYGAVTSAVVTLAVKPADTTPPTVQYATGSKSFTQVRIWFSEPLDAVSAQTASNYQISDGVTVTSAKLSAPAGSVGDNIVDLVTSTQTAAKTYTVTINGVKDQSFPGNSVAANSTLQFTAFTLVQGYLTFEHYDNLSGATDADITKALADPRVVAGTPTTAGFLIGRFDTRTIFADDTHENYLSRTTGFITPTESGDYNFFLRSDDASRLYLSANETMPNPATATPIAIETGCCQAFQEPGSAVTSETITLQAGKRYAIMVLHKEGGGGDWMMVAWRNTSDPTPAAELPFLPGQYLSTLVDPNVDIQFTKQPVNQAGVLPSPVVEFVAKDFKANDGGFTVENTDPAPPGPWVYDAANGQWSADGSESACTVPKNSKLHSPAYTVPETEEVTLDFSHRYSFEADRYDGGQVRISVNGGEFATVPGTNFIANGYTATSIQGNGVLNGQAAFNADSPGYATGSFITSSVILGSFKKGDTIVVEFVGAWDECSTASVPGWVIKNVKLAYGKAPRAATFEASATATKQGQPSAFSYQWQRNDGTGFVDIAGANTASFRIFPTAADFSASFRLVASIPGKAVNSSVVKLTQGSVTVPEISIKTAGGVTTITFTGTLQSSASVAGPYQGVTGAQSPYTAPSSQGTMFFRSVK
jgi:hypothetical protein